jgi:hypothetical protein
MYQNHDQERVVDPLNAPGSTGSILVAAQARLECVSSLFEGPAPRSASAPSFSRGCRPHYFSLNLMVIPPSIMLNTTAQLC